MKEQDPKGSPQGRLLTMGLGWLTVYLKTLRQGGVYSKLSRTDLVGLLGNVVYVIKLELPYCNRLGLEQYALPSWLYKERQERTPCTINHTQQPNTKAPHVTGLGYYAIQRPELV
jgi:hypothetical protein